MLNQNIFRAYDIRGIAHKPEAANPDLTPETMELIGRGAGTYFLRNFGKKIVLGYDCRLSNPELAEAFIEGLRSTSCDVTSIGMVPTPMLYFAVCKYGFDGGAAITASHNPKEYNGVKLVGKDARSICGDELQDIYTICKNADFDRADPDRADPEQTNPGQTNLAQANPNQGDGKYEELDVFPAYLEKICSIVHLERPLKIVVDSGNGSAGPYAKPFFEAIGCEVIDLFSDPDGNFPNHPANPEELENMQDLIAAVTQENAALGIGFDGDGDRVGVVDENGHHYNADLLLLLVARDLLSRLPGSKIVFDVKVSQVLIDDIRAHGGEPVMEKTGHSFIEKSMRELNAPLGGEISGHMFFGENYYGFDDAFLAAARLLEILSRTDGTLSQLFADVAKTSSTPEIKSGCPDDKKFQIVDSITKNFVDKYDCVTLDGVRVNFDDKSWGAVRCSNTSPNLTIRFEAPNNERLQEIIDIMLEELRKYPEIDLWWAEKKFN